MNIIEMQDNFHAAFTEERWTVNEGTKSTHSVSLALTLSVIMPCSPYIFNSCASYSKTSDYNTFIARAAIINNIKLV
jgi:hypothetical protein